MASQYIQNSEIPLKPIVDEENPLYCPAESASKYLKSIANDAKIRKHKKHNGKIAKKNKKISVSSFAKMLAQVAVVMQKEKEGKEKITLPLSQISTNDCYDYGTPPLAGRPVRKTRKDRAAQSLLNKIPDPLIRDLSPNFDSISISLPEIPSPPSTISHPNSTFTISNGTVPSPIAPLVPPGLETSQVKIEPQEDPKKLQFDTIACSQPAEKSLEKRNKRNLQDAFPELLEKPAKFSRSFTCEPQSDSKPMENQEVIESLTATVSLELEAEDLKVIKRGKKLNYRMGNSPASETEVRRYWNDMEDEFVEVNRRLKELEESLYGPAIGTETPRGYEKLVNKLDKMMPGIRLGKRLGKLEKAEDHRRIQHQRLGPHQAAADLLGAEGLLNERIINLFRTSEITRLDLSASLSEEGGLNMGGKDVWDVLARPHSFLFLTELTFNNTPILDIDLVKLVGLPRLAVLGLINTGIGDEGVYHLVALKLTLTHLYLSYNPCISDDAVPALNLCIASKLRFLGLVGTSIAMPGLRRMAKLIQREERIIDIEIPEECEKYVDDIPHSYLLHPQPPLITSSVLCSKLSVAALQRNLEAHAEVANKYPVVGGTKAAPVKIFTGGTKEEMCERLKELLSRREVDLVVWGMIYGYGDGDRVDMSRKDDMSQYLETQAVVRDVHEM